MITYRDLRKSKKGIILLCIEATSVIGIALYEYFFETHVLLPALFLANIKASNGIFKLFGFVILFAIISYFIYYSKTLGLIYQIITAIPLGFLVSDFLSGHLFLSIICSALFTLSIYYLQIIRPIQLSRRQYLQDLEANGVTQYKYLGKEINGQKKLNKILHRYDALNNKAMHIFSNMRSTGKKFPEQFSFISKQVLSIKKIILSDLEELCTANGEDFDLIFSDITISLDEFQTDVDSLHTMFNLHLSKPHMQYQNPKPSEKATHKETLTTPSIPNESFDFFLGCDDSMKLKKRYRDLMKTYHSDGVAGNNQIAIEINAAYEKAKNQI